MGGKWLSHKSSSCKVRLIPHGQDNQVLLVQSLVQEAGVNSWHVVGTCSPDDPSVSQGKGEVPVMDCHRYVLQGPTILVLGELAM